MKLRIILSVVALIAVAAIWIALRPAVQAPTTNSPTNTNSASLGNQNAGIPQTLVPAIVFTGTVTPFESAFAQPDTRGWKTATVFERDVMFHPQFFPCSSTLLGPRWDLILTADCTSNQDAPSLSVQDITEKLKQNSADLKFIYAKDVATSPEHQVRSDEIRGTVSGTAVWCYDDSQTRYCELKRQNGQTLMVTGAYFHNSTNVAAHQKTFRAVIRALADQ